MAKYSIFKTGAGGVVLSVRSLTMSYVSPRISLITEDASTLLTGTVGAKGTPKAGIHEYILDAETVELLRSAPFTSGPPSLFFTCHALFHPGAPDRKWGWGMRVSRDNTPLPCVDESGALLRLDSNGFRSTSLRTFPDGKKESAGADIITFV